MITYATPIPIHSDTGILHAVGSYVSRKYRDTVLIFQTGEKRFIHMTATEKQRVGSTTAIRKPQYNSFAKKESWL